MNKSKNVLMKTNLQLAVATKIWIFNDNGN